MRLRISKRILFSILNRFPQHVKISPGIPEFPIHEKEPVNLIFLMLDPLNPFQNEATLPPGPNDFDPDPPEAL